MLTAPVLRHLTYSREPSKARVIDTEYHIELCAESTQDLAQTQKAMLELQAQAAEVNVRALGEVYGAVREMNEQVGELVEETRYMSNQLGELDSTLRSGLECLDKTIADGLVHVDATLSEGFSVVGKELLRTVEALHQQQVTLDEIASTLSRPYETKVLELLKKGAELLKLGEFAEEKEQLDNWRDALACFRSVVANEVGASNCVAWFNIGWLVWQIESNHRQAEESFYNAQRYSAREKDIWHTKALRHMAEMQFRQAKYEDAWKTASKCLAVRREYETAFNAARYASMTERTDDAASLLKECIDLKPTTIVTMFDEQCFMASKVTLQVRDEKILIARREANEALDRLPKIATAVTSAEECGVDLALGEILGEASSLLAQLSRISTMPFLEALGIKERATKVGELLLSDASHKLNELICEATMEIEAQSRHLNIADQLHESEVDVIRTEHEMRCLNDPVIYNPPVRPDGCAWSLLFFGAIMIIQMAIVFLTAFGLKINIDGDLQGVGERIAKGDSGAIMAVFAMLGVGLAMCWPVIKSLRARKIHRLKAATSELKLHRELEGRLRTQQKKFKSEKMVTATAIETAKQRLACYKKGLKFIESAKCAAA